MAAKALQGMVALVTGGSASIGLASARALAEDGATVVITGRSRDGLSKALVALKGQLPDARVETFVGDAAREDELKNALAFAHGLAGRLDIIVSAVGGALMRPLLMREAEDVRREFEVNFMTAFLAVRYGAPLMSEGGAIVCISTTAVSQALWGMSIYGAAKAAVERFVRAAAFELGSAQIRVNAVRPGLTVSPEAAASGNYEAVAAETPLGRVGMPDDLARVVRFLAGPESGWVTGQTFSADGGADQGKGADMMDMMLGKDVMDQIRAGKAVPLSEGAPAFASTSLRPPRS
jgi:NAD(P)-dependent dehydrogenase (short-subunit alcohol dehydrogenase family)